MTTTANDEGDQRPIGYAGHEDNCRCKQCKNKKNTKNIMNKMIRRKNLSEGHKGGKIRIKFKDLKKNEKPLKGTIERYHDFIKGTA